MHPAGGASIFHSHHHLGKGRQVPVTVNAGNVTPGQDWLVPVIMRIAMPVPAFTAVTAASDFSIRERSVEWPKSKSLCSAANPLVTHTSHGSMQHRSCE